MSTAAEVRRILAGRRAVRRVAALGAGTDHVAYEVDGDLVVRFSTETDAAARAAATLREAALLEAVAPHSPLPTPVPELVMPEHGCIAYRRLPGAPLLELGRGPDAAAPAVLAGFLAAVHAMPAERMEPLAGRDDHPPGAWLAEAGEHYREIGGRMAVPDRRAVEAFLAAPAPGGDHRPCFCHNDLGAEHVLADPASGALTGVIDWGDAAVTDPARDFALVLRDLGPAALDAVLAAYDRDAGDRDALRARAAFLARCKALEDLAHGVATGRREYERNALAALRRLG